MYRQRTGSQPAADNTLLHGSVTDPAAGGSTAAIRAFNDRVRADQRVEGGLLTVVDGLTLARKR